MKRIQNVAEERKDVIIQTLGVDSILNIGQIMDELQKVSTWRKKMKGDMVSFNRKIVEENLNEMVQKGRIFRNKDGKFTRFDHHRGLCHVFNGERRCLCCGGMSREGLETVREKPLVYCPRCEQFNPLQSVAKVS